MPRARATMWAMVRKLCALARVSPVCTHSLRGLYATLAVQSGSTSHVVASSLGHGSFEITQRHYAQASSVANASTARVLSILDSPMQGEEQAIALAADLSARLERPVLLRLAQLLSQSYESLEVKNYIAQSIRNRSRTLKWRILSDDSCDFSHQAGHCIDRERLTLKRSAAMRDASANRRWSVSEVADQFVYTSHLRGFGQSQHYGMKPACADAR